MRRVTLNTVRPPRKASRYKRNFQFLHSATHRYNAAYHLQFIEYCWQVNRGLTRTTRSLMNRTIIMELASIVEVVLHDALSGLRMSGQGVAERPFPVADHLTLEKLIELAAYCELIEGPLAGQLRELNAGRNAIHFKRFHKLRVLEYDYYKDEMVQKAVETFETFLAAIGRKLSIAGSRRRVFIYPWARDPAPHPQEHHSV
jgi:hypothetical protein